MRTILAVLTVAWITLAAAAAPGDPPPPKPVEHPAERPTQHPAVVYHPPDRGAPEGRISSATRGQFHPSIEALVPGHPGLTLREHPVLYWFSHDAIPDSVALVIVSDAADRPVVNTVIPGPFPPGPHVIRLADFAVRLDLDIDYQWSLTRVGMPHPAAVATIRRISRSGLLPIAGSDAWQDATRLAAAGIWYDALDAAYRAGPEAWRALLGQIGMKSAAGPETK